MSKAFRYKPFLLLILALLIAVAPFRVAQAGGVVDFFGSLIGSILNGPLAIFERIVGTALSPIFGDNNFLISDGECRWEKRNGSALEVYSGRCGEESSVGATLVSPTDACAFQISTTFYNPRPDYYYRYYTYCANETSDGWGNTSCSQVVTVDALNSRDKRYVDTNCASPVSSYWTYSQSAKRGNNCYGTSPVASSYQPMPDYSSEASKSVSIYRFTLPASSDQGTFNSWFLGIKNQVGNGWLTGGGGCASSNTSSCDPGVYNTAPDVGALISLPYSQMCSGNACSFTDATAPDNMYVAYVAKVLGNYTYTYSLMDSWGGASASGFITGTNKFFNKDGSSTVVLPGGSVGNAIAGPYKTGTADCPPVCGDSICNGSETCSSCASDCTQDCNSAPSATNLAASQPDYRSAGPAATFSWTFTDPDAGDIQSAYRIQVATNPGFSDPGTVIDTGKLTSTSNAYATGPGKLAYNQTYYWRLKVWDNHDAESDWIDPSDANASFTTPKHQYPTILDIYWAPANPSVDEKTVFNATVKCFQSGGAEATCPLANYQWTFTGGSPNSAVAVAAPMVTYATNGLYQITLAITDSNGYTTQRTEALNIRLPLPNWKEVAPQ